MSGTLLVAGGGIGGLAAALAAARAGWQVRVFEQAASFDEVGAGLQLGPNATRVLRSWGLLQAAQQAACAPARVVARDAAGGHALAGLALESFPERYGAPYLTLHRADLHRVLLEAVRAAGVDLRTGAGVRAIADAGQGVRWLHADGSDGVGDAGVGADGLWSTVRGQLLGDGPPRPSDHVAYRALVPLARLAPRWQAPEVTAWLGPRLHAVTYPVRGGQWLNLVVVVQQATAGDRTGWNHPAAAERLKAALGARVCPALRELVDAAPGWGLWVLHDRPPVAGPEAMARGRVALLGDAAHPMRPYLAQGAAMALEDAFELGAVLGGLGDARGAPMAVPAALRRYALARWQRCARVQRRSLRNARIFHAGGPVRLARDAALRTMGGRLMDLPWLYAA